MRFQEKKVLVTGAGHGIGLAVAQAFFGEGVRVAINDIIPDRVAAVVEKLGSHCCGVAGDISDTEEARSVVSRAAGELGGMDIVVSNAGLYPSHAFLEMDINDWDPATEYITGQVIPVDGGLFAGRYGIPVAYE